MRAEASVARLRQWVEDLQGDCWVNCIYCGWRFGPMKELPFSTREVFTGHLKKCASFRDEVLGEVW